MPASLIDLIASVAAERGHGQASHAVVGLPGGVDYETGRLLWAPHLPEEWPDQLSTEGLSAHLGLAVSIANDADLAAVGEAAFGAGAASPAVAYLTISTGIGAGVVHGGRLLRGRVRSPRSATPSSTGAPGARERRARSRNWARAAVWPASPRKPASERWAPERSRPRRPRGSRGRRDLAGGDRGLRGRRVEPRHVLLPHHRGHRRRHGQAGGVLQARCASWSSAGPAGIPTTWRSCGPASGTTPACPERPAGRLQPALPDSVIFSSIFPANDLETSVWFSKLQQNCNTNHPMRGRTQYQGASLDRADQDQKETMCVSAEQACSGGSPSFCRRRWSVRGAGGPRPLYVPVGRPTSRPPLSPPTSAS